MILDEIVLHNFGVYRGRQTLALSPPARAKPVILIGGLNGGGKTTLLDALQLGLYGKLARCSNRGSLGYEEFLRRCIHRKVDTREGAAIELQLRHVSDGEEHTYRIHRSWSANGNGANEHVEVLRDGMIDRVLTECWQEHVDEFIPAPISPLFFFDGEKIEALADFESSSQLLGTAIYSLLGLDIVDQLTTDLTGLERRKRVALKSKTEQGEIEAVRSEIKEIEKQREHLVRQRGATQNEVDRLQKRLQQAEAAFKREGGELFSQRHEIESEHNTLDVRLHHSEEDLRELAAGSAPLMLLADLLAAVAEQDRREAESQESHALSTVLSERDLRTIEVARRSGSPGTALAALETFFREDRARRALAAATESHLFLTTETRQQLRGLRASLQGEMHERVGRSVSATEELQRRIVDLERKLSGIPDRETLSQRIGEMEDARVELERSRARLGALDAELERVNRLVEQKQGRLVARIESTVAVDFRREDTERMIFHSRRVRDTLERFRGEVVARHVQRIEGIVLDCFRQLLRKQSLIGDLKINPIHFTMELRGIDGQVLSTDRLSAGERQLLAVSLLWGLGRASGRPLPAVIDTPLGRLDALHRSHMVERYFPNASHQVLLLSTDKEIDENYYDKLKPWIGRSYRLDFDDATSATTVSEGYYW